MQLTKNIEVVPYDPNWPVQFRLAAISIQSALNDNFIAIHHIGSTAVPGLIAKPKIDIIVLVINGNQAINQLSAIGFTYTGEWNIPFKYGFTKREPHSINLHIFEQNHPEVSVNLLFRDHLINNIAARDEYAAIKKQLLADPKSFVKQENKLFTGYNLGKAAFISNILHKAGFNGIRFLHCTHHTEWDEYHRIKKTQIFDPVNIKVKYNPNHPTFTEADHKHFILAKGLNVVAIAHIELLDPTTAALRALATDEPYKLQGFASKIFSLVELWLKNKNISIIKTHARLTAEHFYRKHGFVPMEFLDQSISEDIIDMGKLL